MYITVPFVFIVNFRLFGITLFIHLNSFSQFLIFTMRQIVILLSIISVHPAASQITVLNCLFPISPCGNSNPGHGTKFVTLPSSILLCVFPFKTGSMCLVICDGNSYCLMWLVLLSLCGHK